MTSRCLRRFPLILSVLLLGSVIGFSQSAKNESQSEAMADGGGDKASKRAEWMRRGREAPPLSIGGRTSIEGASPKNSNASRTGDGGCHRVAYVSVDGAMGFARASAIDLGQQLVRLRFRPRDLSRD
jgi:hypothetical protein